MAFLCIQVYIGAFIGVFFAGMIVGIFVMINGLYMMIGSKFSRSADFWRGKIGGGYPLWFGAIINFYLDIIGIVIVCIYLVVVVAPTLIQRLFILLIGTTVVCVLLHFRFKNRIKLD